jgi:hypothetical protein
MLQRSIIFQEDCTGDGGTDGNDQRAEDHTADESAINRLLASASTSTPSGTPSPSSSLSFGIFNDNDNKSAKSMPSSKNGTDMRSVTFAEHTPARTPGASRLRKEVGTLRGTTDRDDAGCDRKDHTAVSVATPSPIVGDAHEGSEGAGAANGIEKETPLVACKVAFVECEGGGGTPSVEEDDVDSCAEGPDDVTASLSDVHDLLEIPSPGVPAGVEEKTEPGSGSGAAAEFAASGFCADNTALFGGNNGSSSASFRGHDSASPIACRAAQGTKGGRRASLLNPSQTPRRDNAELKKYQDSFDAKVLAEQTAEIVFKHAADLRELEDLCAVKIEQMRLKFQQQLEAKQQQSAAALKAQEVQSARALAEVKAAHDQEMMEMMAERDTAAQEEAVRDKQQEMMETMPEDATSSMHVTAPKSNKSAGHFSKFQKHVVPAMQPGKNYTGGVLFDRFNSALFNWVAGKSGIEALEKTLRSGIDSGNITGLAYGKQHIRSLGRLQKWVFFVGGKGATCNEAGAVATGSDLGV